uniref:CD93 molecule n=1 Tax=Sus scrofa TaxID=9823 RepID=A0A8D1QI42_PIG
MTTSPGLLLLLLLLLVQPREGATSQEAVVCVGTACYSAHWGKLSADEAQLHCDKKGGNLATLKSEEEARHVQGTLAQLLQPGAPLAERMGRFWIGLQRDKGKCLDSDLPLKGFRWVDGVEDTPYTNWHKEAKNSCISKRCVSLLLDLSTPALASRLSKWAEGPCGSSRSPGNSVEGFVCKFSFKGMCRPLALGGPGQVTYTTPFQATSSTLQAVPFGSMAHVACGDRDESQQPYFLCKEKAPNVFEWNSSGPLCISPKLGCDFNNGGCEQDCFEGGDGSFRCGCRPGYRLLDDLVSCASRNPCSSSPCRGGATCVPVQLGKDFRCHCPPGYQLDLTGRDCVDVDECQDAPCTQECVNTPGSFRCECWVGYERGGPGEGACQDVDECAPGRSPCAQGCTNTIGSFSCSCEDGYILAGEEGTQCLDLDECEGQGARRCGGLCLNTEGSFRCGCLPGWELAPDGVSCTGGPTSPAPSAGTPQVQDTGDGEGEHVSSATASSPTGDPEGTSETTWVVPTTGRSSLPRHVRTSLAPPEMLVPSGTLSVWSPVGPLATPGQRESTGDDFTAKHSDSGTDGQKLLLFYILGTVVAILLLLALALGLLVYRKRRAKREEKEKPKNAADSYAWVPERAESRAAENPYSPTPGTDC